jgi:hypothetical protein
MATEQRIYKITSTDKAYLVQATSQAQALRHIAGRQFGVEIAKAIDVAQFMSKGIQLEVASVEHEQAQISIKE